jgi:hypothetical protein
MRDHQERGEPYSKASYRRDLLAGALKGRNNASVEFRMRNISAVLAAHAQPVLNGYVPAKNVGRAIADKLWSLVVQELSSLKQPPIIYFNIGWMKHYAGPSPEDFTLGGMGYLADHQHGAEAYNFLPGAEGMLLGYRPGHANRLSLTRLCAPTGTSSLDGVLVIWMAREPATKRQMIVGWYQNATVYAEAQPQSRTINGVSWPYSVSARQQDSYLVPERARTFQLQSARTSPGGFGMSPTWYGTDEVNQRVWAYVQSIQGGKRQPTGQTKKVKKPPINTDPELRRRVEKAAVQHAWGYLESAEGGSHTVVSVEPFGKGWDLEATNGEGCLLVEVKGLQGTDLLCELTPNEYKQMNLVANRDRYVVYVVNNALGAVPIASIFKRAADGEWWTEDGRQLIATERMAAVLSCK